MEFKHIQGLTPDGTVYYNEDMRTLEAMVPPGKYSTAHAPALLELENGDMLCAWFLRRQQRYQHCVRKMGKWQ